MHAIQFVLFFYTLSVYRKKSHVDKTDANLQNNLKNIPQLDQRSITVMSKETSKVFLKKAEQHQAQPSAAGSVVTGLLVSGNR